MIKKKSDKEETSHAKDVEASKSGSKNREDTGGSEKDTTSGFGLGEDSVDGKKTDSAKKVESEETGEKTEGLTHAQLYDRCLRWCNAQSWARSRPADVIAERMTNELSVYPFNVRNYEGLNIK